MDLLAFADFVLAWDHRNHPASVGYFFKIFDIQHKVCDACGVIVLPGCACDASAAYKHCSSLAAHEAAARLLFGEAAHNKHNTTA
jgi:hypothetical protein